MTCARRGASVLVTQRVVVDSSTGEVRDALAHDWPLWFSQCGLEPIPVCNALSDPAHLLDEPSVAGLILTGGGSISPELSSAPASLIDADTRDLNPVQRRDRTEWLLLSAALRSGLPVLAVCRGMQFVNQYFGGRVRKGIAAPSGSHPRPGSQHDVRLVPDHAPLALQGVARATTVRSYHDDGILASDVAHDLVPWAWASDDIVEGMSHVSHDLVCVQWHPEREPHHPWSSALLAPMIQRALA